MSRRDSLFAKPDSGTVGRATGAAIPDSWRCRCSVRTSLPAPLVSRVLLYASDRSPSTNYNYFSEIYLTSAGSYDADKMVTHRKAVKELRKLQIAAFE